MSARLLYRYTDGTGRRVIGSVVLRGEPSSDHAARIRRLLMDEQYFIAFQVGLRDLYPMDPEEAYPYSVPIDSVEHEFLRIVSSDEPVTDLLDRDVEEFIHDLARVPAWDISPFGPA